MANLKELRGRIASVKSTRKIVTAMKMVASSKLRRAQVRAMHAVPYAETLNAMLRAASGEVDSDTSALLRGNDNAPKKKLIIVMGSDRGLCGGFNSAILKLLRDTIVTFKNDGYGTDVVVVGNKLLPRIKGQYNIIHTVPNISKNINFQTASEIGVWARERFLNNEYDACSVIYSHFVSVLSQIPTLQQIMPLNVTYAEVDGEKKDTVDTQPRLYEPSKEELLDALLPKNVDIQIYLSLLQNSASEEAARMNAMDNASRNAKDVIDNLTKVYNQTRQAYITKELIEIIAGSEAA